VRGGGESADGSKLGVPQSIAGLPVAAVASNESLLEGMVACRLPDIR